MSSWLAGPQGRRSRIRLGYYQERPLGTFRSTEKDATVVSAYYDLPSKYNTESYRTWLRLFLENCPCQLVFFTDEATKPFIEQCRAKFKIRTRIIVLPPSQWTFETRFPLAVWKGQQENDPERSIHSIPLYKVWNEKKEFVKRAIQLNPFASDAFVWIDAGFVRSEGLARFIKDFPVASRIPTDRMLMLNIGDYTEKDNTPVDINGIPIYAPHGKMRIGGGILAGTTAVWKAFDKAYEEQLQNYIDAGLFFGKEQNILGSLAIANRTLVSFVEPRPIGPEAWFYLGLWLSAPERMWIAMNDENRNKLKANYETLWEMCQP
jgi:hypothetical protein